MHRDEAEGVFKTSPMSSRGDTRHADAGVPGQEGRVRRGRGRRPLRRGRADPPQKPTFTPSEMMATGMNMLLVNAKHGKATPEMIMGAAEKMKTLTDEAMFAP